jgi:hypothetical protein
MTDNWKHRSQGMRCGSCMWFAAKAKQEADTAQPLNPAGDLGRCRRHAPTMAGFPAVFTTDWCGDHKLNENAV